MMRHTEGAQYMTKWMSEYINEYLLIYHKIYVEKQTP